MTPAPTTPTIPVPLPRRMPEQVINIRLATVIMGIGSDKPKIAEYRGMMVAIRASDNEVMSGGMN